MTSPSIEVHFQLSQALDKLHHKRNIEDRLNFLHQMLHIACLPGAQM
uniref:Uncharacterized protein n=1 Tax=Arundo donax TaxID=35708 RepID=A0A0A9HR55_ARUDO